MRLGKRESISIRAIYWTVLLICIALQVPTIYVYIYISTYCIANITGAQMVGQTRQLEHAKVAWKSSHGNVARTQNEETTKGHSDHNAAQTTQNDGMRFRQG